MHTINSIFNQSRRNIMVMGETLFIAVILFSAFTLLNFGHVVAADNNSVIPDSKITRAVESTLLLDEDIPSHLIDVRTQQGIVTLEGEMPHYRAKERAGNLVETLRGVQSVINQMTVKISNRSDEEIRNSVKKALKNDAATEAYEIEVMVNQGTVTLTGTVPSWAARELSQWVATGVYGVRDIKNSLRPNLKEPRADEIMLDEIQRRLEGDVWINADTVLLSVEDGVVTLDGVVGSFGEKRRVQSLARVAGVKEVKAERLFVKGWAKKRMRRKSHIGYNTDDEIKDILLLAYAYDPRVSVVNPNVEVRHGIVTLTGVIDNLKAKRAAEDIAFHTRGVFWVKNYLKVRPKSQIEDKALKKKVEMALHEDLFINRFQLQVTVHEGIVGLRGSVETHFQKQQAEETVSGVKGVVDIKNELTVDRTWKWKPDEVIQRDIENELWWSPFIDSDDISVTVKDGVATLSGTVNNYFEYETAIENAREGGARRVETLLTVKKYQGLEVLPDRPL